MQNFLEGGAPLHQVANGVKYPYEKYGFFTPVTVAYLFPLIYKGPHIIPPLFYFSGDEGGIREDGLGRFGDDLFYLAKIKVWEFLSCKMSRDFFSRNSPLKTGD